MYRKIYHKKIAVLSPTGHPRTTRASRDNIEETKPSPLAPPRLALRIVVSREDTSSRRFLLGEAIKEDFNAKYAIEKEGALLDGRTTKVYSANAFGKSRNILNIHKAS